MVNTKLDILNILDEYRDHLRALGVRRIGLFGSFVRGEQRPDSDIDLLVEFEPARKTFDTFNELCIFLEEILQRRIELVTVESLSPYLGPHILREVEYAAWDVVENKIPSLREDVLEIFKQEDAI
ncbi:MAG: nucleotidyltransferase family protein [Syntrophobacteraceae bacterium]|jgi:predicted nucleotidyltransferase